MEGYARFENLEAWRQTSRSHYARLPSWARYNTGQKEACALGSEQLCLALDELGLQGCCEAAMEAARL